MKIIFVYNANSGAINTLLDIGHKILSPQTYECNLCQITYGIVRETEEWKAFRESSTDELEFLHKDEFEEKYQEKRDYPVILKMNKDKKLEELLGTEELNRLKSGKELIQKLKELKTKAS